MGWGSEIMKYFTFIVLILGVYTSGTYADSRQEQEKILRQTIGDLIINVDNIYSHRYEDNAFGSGPLTMVFQKHYDERIRDLPQDMRIEYFWAAMWHLEFQNGTMGFFVDLIVTDDCVDAYLSRLSTFIKKQKSLDRKHHLLQAEHVHYWITETLRRIK